MYLGHREAFSEQDARIAIHVEVSNSSDLDPGILRGRANHTELCWEFWDGQAWTAMNPGGKSLRLGVEDSGTTTDTGTTNFSDETQALMRSGVVTFSFTRPPVELTLNGIKSYWVRVRISAGDYGREIQVQRDESTGALSTIPATLAPPSIRLLKIDYSVEKEAKPSLVVLNEWEVTRGDSDLPFRPFTLSTPDDTLPSLYLGFKAPVAEASNANQGSGVPPVRNEGSFPHLPVSAYVLIDERAPQARNVDSCNAAAVWEYWTGANWKKFTVADQTENLQKSGVIQFLLPGDFSQSDRFGKRRFWLRMLLGESEVPPIRSVLLNTTMAVQGISFTNEILGGSNGEPNQHFRTMYPSVLPGQLLEVCEPTMPSQDEQEVLRGDEDVESPIEPTTERNGKAAYWVSWREVDSFYGSGARDRHYMLDHLTGEVIFGDGVCGMIPPILAGNLRMRRYRTGGGTIGNQPAQAVNQLVSAVPYVQKVVNWVPAAGGNDSEPADAVFERGPRELRHRGRAVTIEDFEDLALRASQEVARARCLPQCHLVDDPYAMHRRSGLISLIIVPRSHDAKPVPSMDLIERVKGFLDARRLATAELVVVGPEYVRVNVEAEIVVNRPEEASDVEQKIGAALKSYLHPIRGGQARSGWDFGRLPQRSDLYVLIERIPGVSHIRNLNVRMIAERPGVEKTGHFLVYSGHHTLTMTL
jgi:hypothetical protein